MNAMFSDTLHACFSFNKCHACFPSDKCHVLIIPKPCDQQTVLFTACQAPRTSVMLLHLIYLKRSRSVYLPFLTRCPPPVCGVRWWSQLRPGPSNTACLDSHQGASDRHMSLREFCIERMYAVSTYIQNVVKDKMLKGQYRYLTHSGPFLGCLR